MSLPSGVLEPLFRGFCSEGACGISFSLVRTAQARPGSGLRKNQGSVQIPWRVWEDSVVVSSEESLCGSLETPSWAWFSAIWTFDESCKAGRHSATPIDLRYLQRGVPSKSEKSTDTSRQRIISFLQGVYDSIAETLPDVKDETCDFDTSAVTIDLPETNDPYAAALGSIHIPEATSNAGMSKVRKHKMSVEFNVSRKHAQEERFLPPGHIRDFWEQMKVSEELGANEKHVAFSTFWRVWHQEFPFLRFRSSSSHGQCGTCLRHKLIIRGLAGHLNARQQQINLYVEHLRSQYNDRLCYWQLRGSIAPRNPISEDVKKDIIKHLPVMRALGLDAGADYLHAWAMGELPLEQLASARPDRRHVEHYVGLARKRIVLQSAANAWAQGVPWGQALKICRTAIKKADAVGRIQSEKFYLIGFWWRITYSEDMSPGGKYLRVFHLGFRTDFGLPGMSDSFDMEWQNATQVARAFSIGKSEAQAISNLQDKINPEIVTMLKESTRVRGMRQFMNHDLLCKDLFNRGFSSGASGALCAWGVDLSNNDDNELVKLFIQRLNADWDRIPPGLKKPWGFKDASAVHSACGGFLAIMTALKAEIPQSDFAQNEAQIREQFHLGYLDPDIIHFLESTIPPVNLQE
ncbi:FO synthase subunit 1, partial [Durusdinium trenchii]